MESLLKTSRANQALVLSFLPLLTDLHWSSFQQWPELSVREQEQTPPRPADMVTYFLAQCIRAEPRLHSASFDAFWTMDWMVRLVGGSFVFKGITKSPRLRYSAALVDAVTYCASIETFAPSPLAQPLPAAFLRYHGPILQSLRCGAVTKERPSDIASNAPPFSTLGLF